MSNKFQSIKKKLLEKRGLDFYIPILKLKHVTPLHTILYEILKPFGFNFEQTKQTILLLNSEPGQRVENEHFSIFKDRNFFIIAQKNNQLSENILIKKNTKSINTEKYKFEIKTIAADKNKLSTDAAICQADVTQLSFPLLLRKWRQGDYMKPLGMQKKKKISRILIDNKMPLHEKENRWVIESAKKIVWLVGLKLDDRFKITDNTKEIFYIKIINK